MKGVVLAVLLFVALCFAQDPLPSSFTWQTKGVVGPVMTQGVCGSTYVYDIVNTVASAYAIATGTYQALSPDQVINCTETGCNGGQGADVWSYISEHGLALNWEEGDDCPTGTSGVCIKGNGQVQAGNETALAYALLQYGPLAVAIDGSNMQFELYTSGVYAPSGCSTTNLDTTLLLIGWTPEAWICQNTWGTGWGMNGYILMARNQNNMCGIATDATYAIGAAAC